MSPSPRTVVRALAHCLVQTAAFVVAGIAVVQVAVGLSLPFAAAVPLTIGALSASPVVGRRLVAGLLEPRLEAADDPLPTASPAH